MDYIWNGQFDSHWSPICRNNLKAKCGMSTLLIAFFFKEIPIFLISTGKIGENVLPNGSQLSKYDSENI